MSIDLTFRIEGWGDEETSFEDIVLLYAKNVIGYKEMIPDPENPKDPEHPKEPEAMIPNPQSPIDAVFIQKSYQTIKEWYSNYKGNEARSIKVAEIDSQFETVSISVE